MPSLNGSIRKRDELLQRKVYEDVVIEKHNLTDKGWYNGTRALKNIRLDKGNNQSNTQVKLSSDLNQYR
jgi:hypothetical protein